MQPLEVLITLIIFIFAGFILYLLAARNRAQLRYRMEVQKELIAKFSSSRELAEFLNSEAGKLLIVGTRIDYGAQFRHHPKPKKVKEIIGQTVAWGVLILAVGVAIFMVRGLTTVSALFIALGVGFEINAFLGYILSKKWGTWDLVYGDGIDTGTHDRHHPTHKTAKDIVGPVIAWGVLILAVGVSIFMTRGLTIASALFMALGVGLEINAFLGYFFSKKWGTWDVMVDKVNARIPNP